MCRLGSPWEFQANAKQFRVKTRSVGFQKEYYEVSGYLHSMQGRLTGMCMKQGR